MKIYISGPISGAQELSLNAKKDRFNNLERWLESQGDVEQVINPLKTGNDNCTGCEHLGHVGQDGKPEHSWSCYMKHDIVDLMRADAIVMLPRWEASPGAAIELSLAISLDYRVFFATKLYEEDPWGWMINEYWMKQTKPEIRIVREKGK